MTIDRLRTLKAEKDFSGAYNLYREMLALQEADAETHLIGGQAAKALGNLFAARHALKEALESEPAGKILGTVRFVFGEVLRQLGEVHAAIDEISHFLLGMSEYPDLEPILRGAALYNRALARRQAKQYADSLLDYHSACGEFRREGMHQYLCMALHNLAWVSCVVGAFREATEALDEARPLCTTEKLGWHHAIGEVFWVVVSADPPGTSGRLPQLSGALDRCLNLLRETAGTIPEDVRSHACWLAGRIGLELGELDAAEQLAHRAVAHAIAAGNENRCLSDAAELLRAIRQLRFQERTSGST